MKKLNLKVGDKVKYQQYGMYCSFPGQIKDGIIGKVEGNIIDVWYSEYSGHSGVDITHRTSCILEINDIPIFDSQEEIDELRKIEHEKNLEVLRKTEWTTLYLSGCESERFNIIIKVLEEQNIEYTGSDFLRIKVPMVSERLDKFFERVKELGVKNLGYII